MRLTQLALLAVGLMTLACAPTQAHRELFTHDCQGQLHMMSDTPLAFSFGAKDFDKMWSHVVLTLKTRLKCKCGQDMDPDEFLRKFHPLPAVLNLLSLQPVTNEACNTTFSALYPEVKTFFQDYVRKYGKGATQNGPVIPCSYTDLASPGGCKFELKPKSATLDIGLGVAMKTCPSNPDMTFVSVVVKGALVDNLAKPCDAINACGVGLVCKDASTLYPGRRRLWSLFEPFNKLFSAITESKVVRVIKEKLSWLDADSVDAMASALRSLGQTLKEGFDKVHAAEIRRRGRRLFLTPSDNDVWSVLKEGGLYDNDDGMPGCLTFSQLVANARGFAQAFFPYATVSQDATYNVCVPQFSTTNFDVSKFFLDNWGLTWVKETAPPNTQLPGFFVTIPFTSWSGDLSGGRKVLDATRLDGSYFVGSATALRPPAANTEQKILPFFGTTCSGEAFLQVGDKLGVGMSFKGLSSMFSFVMEQAVKMQQCRANQRSPDFVFARPDFMKHFALYTPIAWLSLMMKTPAGKEFDIMSEKLVNDWNKLEIRMSTVVKKMFTEVLKMQDFAYRFDMSSVSTCNAKDYSTRGCAMSLDISEVGVGGVGTNAVFGMKQCFSASPAVPFPVIVVSLIGGNTALTAWPVKSCSVNTDCPIGLECANGLGLTDALKGLDDPFDLLIYGSSDSSPPSGSCKSAITKNNKGIAKIVEYFTKLTQADDKFAFCLPKFTLPDLAALAEKQPDKYDGKDLYKIKGLNSYAGVLPGLTDQPSLVFFFPPADSESYAWPQKMQRRVEWTSFNFQSGSKITLNLRNAGGGVIDTKSLDNDNSEPYTMAADRGPGYWLEICSSTGVCWASGRFAVVAEITNRATPVKGTQSWPNNGQDFTAGSEVYGVFAGAVKTNLAQVLRAASHRIEIEKIASVARRAGSSVTVTYLIHPDDTGKDLRTVGSLLEKAQSPALKDAVVGNLAAFATTAQTTNPAALSISQSGVFTNVTAARNVESAINISFSKGISIRSNGLFTFFVAFFCSGIVFR